MKRLLILLLLLLTLCSCEKKTTDEVNTNSSTSNETETKPDETKPEEIEVQSGYSNLKMVNLQQTKKKILYEDSFILVVTQTSCGHCKSYKPVLNKVLSEHNILAYEIDIQLLDEEEYDEALEYLGVDSTPTTLFFIKGKEQTKYRLRGVATTNQVKKAIKELKY